MSDPREDPDDPVSLLRDVLAAVETGFKETSLTIGEVKAVAEQAHGGVVILSDGLRAIQHTVDTMADGILQLSAQIAQVRAGVADQVRLEVEKRTDDERPFASLPDKLDQG